MKLDVICDGCKTTKSVVVTNELTLNQAAKLVNHLDKILKKHIGHTKFVHFKTTDECGIENKYILHAFQYRIEENERKEHTSNS